MTKKKKTKDSNPDVNVTVSVVWNDKYVKPTKQELKARKKNRKSKSPKNQKVSQSVRKAPRASRSASSRRWKDLRETDGKVYEVKVFKASELDSKQLER